MRGGNEVEDLSLRSFPIPVKRQGSFVADFRKARPLNFNVFGLDASDVCSAQTLYLSLRVANVLLRTKDKLRAYGIGPQRICRRERSAARGIDSMVSHCIYLS